MSHYFSWEGLLWLVVAIAVGRLLITTVIMLATDLYRNLLRIINPQVHTAYAGVTTLLFYLPLICMVFTPGCGLLRVLLYVLIGLALYVIVVLISLQDMYRKVEDVDVVAYNAVMNYLVYQEPVGVLFVSAILFRWLAENPVLG